MHSWFLLAPEFEVPHLLSPRCPGRNQSSCREQGQAGVRGMNQVASTYIAYPSCRQRRNVKSPLKSTQKRLPQGWLTPQAHGSFRPPATGSIRPSMDLSSYRPTATGHRPPACTATATGQRPPATGHQRALPRPRSHRPRGHRPPATPINRLSPLAVVTRPVAISKKTRNLDKWSLANRRDKTFYNDSTKKWW